ncbi:hypothetical protein SASPL_156871 [Salvia splendens]|uniref:H15 domain-containing protein n=1 Tax=Salvia splendens TaxID=180675 RepID=A0A8X8VVW7_SALSN|nr:hypothetical protein SASPL_156871 [Salvia splendens]
MGLAGEVQVALKRMHPTPKHGESSMLSTYSQSDDELVDARSLDPSGGSSPNDGPMRSIMRLDNLIMEAISNLREPGGSNKTSIATYIEDQYWAPPNFKRILSAKLKHMAATGKLIKIDDVELANLRSMTPQEAAVAAAQAVAEAEAAMAEAVEAAREAEAAEADAEAAQAFADAAMKTLKGRNTPNLNVQMIHA